jgi:putative CocE/NonD family hydrolase
MPRTCLTAREIGLTTPLTRLTDRAATRLLRLPPPTTDYTVRRDIRILMRDGVELLADHHAPTTSTPAGTILVRGPYGRAGVPALILGRVYAARGYHVVMQSTRGTFGSGGEFHPGRHEVDDGADTVAWLREQPWFTGRFATLGASYLGFTQWALLHDPPPELAAAVIMVGPHDLSEAVWGTGSFALNDFLGWSDTVAHQEGGMSRVLMSMATARWRMGSAMAGLPLGEAGRELLGGRATWYQDWVANPDQSAEYWLPVRLHRALDRADVPILLITGWQDVFLNQTLDQYRLLQDRGVNVALTVGPWTHGQVGLNAAGQTTRESLDWLSCHLAGQPSTRPEPVRIFITGPGEWRELGAWPPAADDKTLYLQPNSVLADQPPRADAPPSRFVYDPADPTPTIGGRLLSLSAGYRNDSRLAQRHDVVAFTGPPLTHDLDVIGYPRVELAHSTDIPHADVFVRLSEVDAKGRSRNVSDGYIRLGQDRADQLHIDLDGIAHRFRAGHRVRLLIAGGSHPRFARNLGTDDPPLTGHQMVRSAHTIAHGSGGISRLVLPTP